MIDEKEEIVEQEKTLDDVQMMLQTVLEARAKDDMRVPPGDYSVEEIPTPNPPHKQVQRSGKRTSISCEYHLVRSVPESISHKRTIYKHNSAAFLVSGRSRFRFELVAAYGCTHAADEKRQAKTRFQEVKNR